MSGLVRVFFLLPSVEKWQNTFAFPGVFFCAVLCFLAK